MDPHRPLESIGRRGTTGEQPNAVQGSAAAGVVRMTA